MVNKNISHASDQQTLSKAVAAIKSKIEANGPVLGATVAEQLSIVDQLTTFSFGQFLLMNRGVNGYWTEYMLTHPMREKTESLCDLERFILEEAPLMLATQERFKIFLRENQAQVHSGNVLASIPCGLMGELFYLDYGHTKDIKLIGIDIDQGSLSQVSSHVKYTAMPHPVELIQADAWQLPACEAFDLISCNGLTIYEPKLSHVSALCEGFYKALKEDGKIVISYLTPPPSITSDCEWQMKNIDQEALLLQKVIFKDVLDARFQGYQTTSQMITMLETAGFEDINVIYDVAHLFPTITAIK